MAPPRKMQERESHSLRRRVSHNAPGRPPLSRESIPEELPAHPGPSRLSAGVLQDDSTRPAFSKHQPFSTHLHEHEVFKRKNALRRRSSFELYTVGPPRKMSRDGPTRIPIFSKGHPSLSTYKERQARLKRKQLGTDIPRVTRDDPIRPASLRRPSPPTFTPLPKEYLAMIKRRQQVWVEYDEEPRVRRRPPVPSEEEDEEEEYTDPQTILETDLDAEDEQEEAFEDASTDGNDNNMTQRGRSSAIDAETSENAVTDENSGGITGGESSNTINVASSVNQLIDSNYKRNYSEWLRGLLSGLRLRNARGEWNNEDIESAPGELENIPVELVVNNEQEDKNNGTLTDSTDAETGDGDTRQSTKKNKFLGWLLNIFSSGKDRVEKEAGREDGDAKVAQDKDDNQPGPSSAIFGNVHPSVPRGDAESIRLDEIDTNPNGESDHQDEDAETLDQNPSVTDNFGRGRNASVLDDVQDEEKNEVDGLLRSFLNALYYSGMNPNYYDDDGNTNEDEAGWNCIPQMRFGIVSTLAIAQGSLYVKNQILFGDGKDGEKEKLLFFYIALAYCINGLLFRCCHIGVMLFKRSVIFRLLKSLRSWKFTSPVHQSTGKIILVATCLSSTLPEILHAIYSAVSEYGWSPSKIIVGNAVNGAGAVLNWQSNNNETSEELIRIQDEYGGNITSIKAVVGTTYFTTNVVGEIFESLNKDFPLICAVQLLIRVRDFKVLLKKKRLGDLTYFQEVWEKFKLLSF